MTEADAEGKGMPVLLRHYLRLGAQYITCAVDPAFSNTLDAFVIVDLANVEEHVLRRFLSSARAAAFLARHRLATAA